MQHTFRNGKQVDAIIKPDGLCRLIQNFSESFQRFIATDDPTETPK